ncbi:MAG: RNA polymerase subunit sigma-70 [Anaerolineaceae bacterium]|nr:RNA polymerase subunit sigma-70 [Anaerolineaceae bacterium]
MESEIPMLKRYAHSLSHNITEAEDLVQECLTRAIAKIDSWQPGTNLQAWLIVILRNVFYNDRRREKRERLSFSALKLQTSQQVDAPQESRMILKTVEAAYMSLSTEQREVLTLITIQGMTYEQTAERLGVNVGTVKSRLSRARTRLHQIMDGCDTQFRSDKGTRRESDGRTDQRLH